MSGETRILASYGSEQDVAKAVIDRLKQAYSLQRPVIENCLFRNLTGFIYDIAKQPGRSFSRENSSLSCAASGRKCFPFESLQHSAPTTSRDAISQRPLLRVGLGRRSKRSAYRDRARQCLRRRWSYIRGMSTRRAASTTRKCAARFRCATLSIRVFGGRAGSSARAADCPGRDGKERG